MTELTRELAAKLDEDLTAIWTQGGLDGDGAIPIVIRCAPSVVPAMARLVATLKGQVRHELPLLGAVAAWIPLKELPGLAGRSDVSALELEQEFSPA